MPGEGRLDLRRARARPSPRGPRRGSRGRRIVVVERAPSSRARSTTSRSLSASSSRRTRSTSIGRKGSRATAARPYTAPAASTFGRSRTRRPAASRRRRRRAGSGASTRSASSRTSRSKSRIVQRWMFGVSYQACGSVPRDRHPAPQREVEAVRPVAEVAGTRRCPARPDAQHLRQHHRRPVRGLQASATAPPRRTSASSKSARPRVDVGLHDRHAPGDAGEEPVVGRPRCRSPRSRARPPGARAARRRRSRGRARASPRGTSSDDDREVSAQRRPPPPRGRGRRRPCGGTPAPRAGTSRGRAARRSRGT